VPAKVRHVGALERLHCLKTFPLFSALPPDELTALAEAAREVFFPKRAQIIAANEPIRDVHFIVEGKVRVASPRRPAGAILESGAGVGLLELLAHTTRTPSPKPRR
jgi:signal-transduction protein with cAMP-binding, CBS, and nucleotidyltransferase domain